ncbi:dihydroorotase [Culicoidibacter larvae]|uniref:Dihydroorotase n=1 Tax=Culicoidibacter larvae TaxID=2579976 RepID=A0A5R8QB57_9FIRM|nr:dihydroorotase [Culicoidibacter larvae]TLG73809.1 dihydroorotase [Culicoidibacter larvae]
MKTVLVNGMVFMPDGEFMQTNVVIADGKILSIGNDVPADAEFIDVSGKLVAPGFIDVHVHLREPGFTHKETIASGSMAAASGGFTQICAMPNTKPVIDNAAVLTDFYATVKRDAVVKVHGYAAITDSLTSEELVDFAALKAAGAFAFTNDGVGVQTADVMYRAMQQAASLDMAVVAHCEDNSLIYGGAVHQGEVSERLGVNGIPSICESVQIARDVLLAEAADCHYHVCHVSTKESVRVIRDAKRAGIRVSAEVTPHHLLLSEDEVVAADTHFKMNPPLRSRADQIALIEGLLDGTIDCIATDHAPHHRDEKVQPITKAPFGIIGLEHTFSLLYSELVGNGICSLEQLLDWLSYKPAALFGMSGGKLAPGQPADIAVIDLDATETIAEPFYSLSANSPFIGWETQGLVEQTFVDGKKVFDRKSGVGIEH